MGRAYTNIIWAPSSEPVSGHKCRVGTTFAVLTPQTLRLQEGSKTATYWQILGEEA